MTRIQSNRWKAAVWLYLSTARGEEILRLHHNLLLSRSSASQFKPLRSSLTQNKLKGQCLLLETSARGPPATICNHKSLSCMDQPKVWTWKKPATKTKATCVKFKLKERRERHLLSKIWQVKRTKFLVQIESFLRKTIRLGQDLEPKVLPLWASSSAWC